MKYILFKIILVFFLFTGIFGCVSKRSSFDEVAFREKIEQANRERQIREEVRLVSEFVKEEERLAKEEERQRIEKIKKEEEEQEKVKIRTVIQKAIASRNVNTIMQALNERVDIINRNRDFLSKDDPVINEAILEVAKLLTRNNNIKLGDFSETWGRYFYLFENRNSNVFDKSVIYYLNWIRPTQLVNKLILIRLADSIEDSILVQNIPVQNLTTDAKGVFWPVSDVFLRYIGLSPLILANGRTIEIPAFYAIYHYQGN